ncbi:hypothetical protein U1Q18_033057, partial [Sarracenia purpurea var. burkii]
RTSDHRRRRTRDRNGGWRDSRRWMAEVRVDDSDHQTRSKIEWRRRISDHRRRRTRDRRGFEPDGAG